MKKLLSLFFMGIIFLMGITSGALTDKLAGYYSFDDASGTNIKDNTTGSLYNGTGVNLNGLAWKSGANCKIGGCLDLLAGTDYAYFGTTISNGYDAWNNYGNNFSISFWFKKATNLGGDAGIIGKFNPPGNGVPWGISGDNGQFHTRIGGSYLGGQGGMTGNNDWSHVVIQYNQSSVNYYINNVFNKTFAVTTDVTSNDSSVILGFYADIGGQDGNFTIDELGYWNRTLSQTEIGNLYNSNSGLAYPLVVAGTEVATVLDSPLNNTNITNNEVFNATVTASGFNLINATFVSWFSNGTTFKTSTQSISGINSNSTSFNISSSILLNGIFWNVLGVQGNGNGTNSSFATANFTNNIVKMVEVNQTFTATELGGSTSNFQIIVDASRGYSPLVPYLVYNGTVNQGSFITSGNRYTFSKSITVPFVTSQQNISFYWNSSINDTTVFTSLTKYQLLNNFSIDNCTLYNNTIFSFYIYDEEYPLAKMVNTTIDYAFNIYNLGRTSTLLTHNLSSPANPSSVCLSVSLNSASNYSLDASLRFHGNETYATRYYNIKNFTLTNSTTPQNRSLYNVNASNSLPFLLTFRDSTSALAPGIIVRVDKQYLATNNFKTVEIPLTDANGQTILNLIRNNAIYNIIMTDISGAVIASFANIVAFCQDYTIGSCSIELSAPGSGQVSFDYNASVGISYIISYSNSTKLISMAFNSINSSTQNVRMRVYTENQFENVTICDTSLMTISGTLTCDISGSTNTNQYFFVDVYSNGNYVETQVINSNIQFGLIGGAFGVNGFFVALLIILFITLIFSDDKQVLIIMLGIGWLVIVSYGLIRGAITGITSGGIWLIITLLIFLWKLKKEEVG